MHTFNGSKLTESERKDCELHYLKHSYKEFLTHMKEKNPEYVVKSIEDEFLSAYMSVEHPRFY